MVNLAERIGRRLSIRVRRGMLEFAETEVVLPAGQREGRRFRGSDQPFLQLIWAEMEDDRWQRVVLTGPTQSGKTFGGLAVPILYHLFEIQERVILAAPFMEQAQEKVNDDLLPIMRASPRLAEWLPRKGRGSRGGKVNSIHFGNGRELRLMSAGGGKGGDKRRAGKTSRVAAMTEIDGMDEAGSTSREADPITQIEGRLTAYEPRQRAYLECTVSTEEGRTWRELKAGTDSRIEIKCPHCAAYVHPEREHLVGWQGAADEIEAAERAAVMCPGCGCLWTEAERIAANHDCRLVHQNPKRSNTLSVRWTSIHNCLKPIGVTAAKEWKAAREEDAELERALCQFSWALPAKPDKVDLSAVTADSILGRQNDLKRGELPAETAFITLGIDLGDHLCHWDAEAWEVGRDAGGILRKGASHTVDYGVIEVPQGQMRKELAVLTALRDFRDKILLSGWGGGDGKGGQGGRLPVRVFVDAGYLPDVVYDLASESNSLVWPCKGFGESQAKKVTRLLDSQGWEGVRLKNGKVLVELISDRWKTQVHDALQIPLGRPGAATIFRAGQGGPREHQSYAKHLTAERKVEVFIEGKGLRKVWELAGGQYRANHWLDARALAYAAAESWVIEAGGADGSAGGQTHRRGAETQSMGGIASGASAPGARN